MKAEDSVHHTPHCGPTRVLLLFVYEALPALALTLTQFLLFLREEAETDVVTVTCAPPVQLPHTTQGSHGRWFFCICSDQLNKLRLCTEERRKKGPIYGP